MLQAPPSIPEGAKNSTPQGRFASYLLQSGENTGSILSKFQMSAPELAALNPDINIQSLSSGQQITVLLPPTCSFPNTYRANAYLYDLGTDSVIVYFMDVHASVHTLCAIYTPVELP